MASIAMWKSLPEGIPWASHYLQCFIVANRNPKWCDGQKAAVSPTNIGCIWMYHFFVNKIANSPQQKCTNFLWWRQNYSLHFWTELFLPIKIPHEALPRRKFIKLRVKGFNGYGIFRSSNPPKKNKYVQQRFPSCSGFPIGKMPTSDSANPRL